MLRLRDSRAIPELRSPVAEPVFYTASKKNKKVKNPKPLKVKKVPSKTLKAKTSKTKSSRVAVQTLGTSNVEKVKVHTTKVFAKLKAAQNKRVVCCRGGARSSKSHSITQYFIERLFFDKPRKILVLRKTLPSLKLSVLPMFLGVLESMNLRKFITYEKQNLNFIYGTNLIHFGSLDDEEKIKSFSKDTEILTKDGFKLIKDVKKGDLVYTMDSKTRKAELKPCTATTSYHHKGKMYQPKSATGDRDPFVGFSVTPEHKVLCRTARTKDFKFVEAQNLPKTYIVPRTAEFDGVTKEVYSIPKEFSDKKGKGGGKSSEGRKECVFPIIPWLKFLGWFLSEGSTCKSDTKYTINLSQHNKVGKQQIIEDLKDFPYKFTEGPYGFYSNGKDLWNFLRKECGCYSSDKRFPKGVLDLHPKLLRHLFDTLMKGDGHKHKSGRFVYSTISEKLKDDVMFLAIKLGYCATARRALPEGENYFPNGKPVWTISISDQKDTMLTNIKTVEYDDMVYCVTVGPYHNVLIRQNNRVMWIGQSSEWNDIWMEEATEFSIDDYRQLKLRQSAPSYGLPNQIMLSFNPISDQHWIKKELLDTNQEPSIQEIVSTYKDNPFLSQEYKDSVEALANQDRNYYNVYACGEWGTLEGLVYDRWEVFNGDTESFPGKVCYGLDFGFSHPSALVRVTVDKKEVLIEEKLYKEGLTNSKLIKEMEKVIPPREKRTCIIYADSAEPDRIKEINDAGFNCKPCKKPKGRGDKKGVMVRIDFCKKFLWRISKDSENFLKEIKGYAFAKDSFGNSLEEPTKSDDHLLDAAGYAIYSSSSKTANIRILG